MSGRAWSPATRALCLTASSMTSSKPISPGRLAELEHRRRRPVKLVIIDYDASNLHSVRKALQALGHQPTISNNPDTVASADAIVLPGVGAARDAMRHLTELGLVPVLRRFGD